MSPQAGIIRAIMVTMLMSVIVAIRVLTVSTRNAILHWVIAVPVRFSVRVSMRGTVPVGCGED